MAKLFLGTYNCGHVTVACIISLWEVNAVSRCSRTVYSFEGPTILYCRTRDMTGRVETELLSKYYHVQLE